MRYGNSWGLTVQRGPWKETPKDLNYGTVNQKHAGHGSWYQVERPSINPAGSYSIPTLKRKKLMYSSTDQFTPKSRPGRLQKSVYTEGIRKEVISTGTQTGLGASTVATQAPDFQRREAFASPEVKSEEDSPSVKDESLSSFYSVNVGTQSDIFYTPVSSFNPSTPTPQRPVPPPIDTSMGYSPEAPSYSPLSSVVGPSFSPITPVSGGSFVGTSPGLSPIVGYSPQQYLDPIGGIQVESSPAVGIIDSDQPVEPLQPMYVPPPQDPVVETDTVTYAGTRKYTGIISNLIAGYPQSTNSDMIIRGQPYRTDDGEPVPVQTIIRLGEVANYYLEHSGPENALHLFDYLTEKMDAPDADRWLRRIYRGIQIEKSERSGPATTYAAGNPTAAPAAPPEPNPVTEGVQPVTGITEEQPITETAEEIIADEEAEEEEDIELMRILDPLYGIGPDENGAINGVSKVDIDTAVRVGKELDDTVAMWLQKNEPDRYKTWITNVITKNDKAAVEEARRKREAEEEEEESKKKNPPRRR